jgi:hypothetical protein
MTMIQHAASKETPEKEGRTRSPITSMNDLLRTLVGKKATISHPEAVKVSPLGHQIKPGFYLAKVVHVYEDMVAVITENEKGAQQTDSHPTRRFIPLHWIKLVSVDKDEIQIHI